ncbi:MAG: RNA methyltransferase [Pseudomonadota bacterium]|nr:RNA methyltransferase [Pseudomonadota bacterium]
MELDISWLGARGDGVSDTSDGPVYVSCALPGERVRVDEPTMRGKAKAANLREILEVAPSRIKPVCRHFSECGGCVAQHLERNLYLGWKQELVAKALNRQGVDADVLFPLAVPPRTRRRIRLAFHQTNGRMLLGYRAARSRQLVDILECPVAVPELVSFLSPLREFLTGRAGKGEVAVTETMTGLDVVVFAEEEPGLDVRLDAPGFCAGAGIARLSWKSGVGELERVLVPKTPQIRFQQIAVEPPPDSFLQPSAVGENILRDFVRQGTEGASAVIDLFAGCGAFSLPIAAGGRKVHAVDVSASQMEALQKAGQGMKLTVETRNLARRPLSAEELGAYQVAVLDPPRAGAAAQISEIAKSDLPAVTYVSCNPATFARDARALTDAGYRIGPVQPVDQFLWSHHVELMTEFRRA